MNIKAKLKKHPTRTALIQVGIGGILMSLLLPLGLIGITPAFIGVILIVTSPLWVNLKEMEN